jgi:hypothetical protein
MGRGKSQTLKVGLSKGQVDMADSTFVKIGTALLKHQVKKLVGEEALGAIGVK